MPKKIQFIQPDYGHLEIEEGNRDVITIRDREPNSTEYQVIFVEKKMLAQFIEHLKKFL